MVLTSFILIYSHDATLLDTRRWVLEKSGFKVMTVSAMPFAIEAMTQESPDLLILCHTLTAEERRSALTAAASLQPPMRILSICFDDELADEGISGETLNTFAGAEALIAATRKALL